MNDAETHITRKHALEEHEKYQLKEEKQRETDRKSQHLELNQHNHDSEAKPADGIEQFEGSRTLKVFQNIKKEQSSSPK